MDDISNIIPSLDTGALQSQVSSLGSIGGRSSGRTATNSIGVAQLDVLEDIREELRTQDGGGGGGLLTGLGLGRALAGGGAAGIGLGIGGTAGIAGLLGGAATRGSLNIAESLGLTSSSVARDRRTGDPSSPLATGLDAGKDTILNLIDPAGIGQTVFESVSPHLMNAVDSATEALQSGFQRASSFLSDLQLPASIRNFSFPSLEVPDFSSIRLPRELRQLTDILDVPDEPPPVAPSVGRKDNLFGGGDQRLLNASTRAERQRPPDVNIDQTLDIGKIEVDPQDILSDLERQVDTELRDLRNKVERLDNILAGRNISI